MPTLKWNVVELRPFSNYFILAPDDPRFRMVDHTDECSNDLVIAVVELVGIIALHITTLDSERKPDLCFSGFTFRIRKFTDEGLFIAPLAPGFRQIRTH